jgi:hypothetical protein
LRFLWTQLEREHLLHYFKNIVLLPGMLFRINTQLKVQRTFLQKELMPTVQKMYEKQDGSISKEDVQKIARYYALAVPAILAEAFAVLRQRPLTAAERKVATYLGATTGLFDDFFEKTTLSDSYIKGLYQLPEVHKGQNDNERLANMCWLKALSGCRKPDLLKACALKVHEAQIMSRAQKEGLPSSDAMLRITKEKGGYSVAFYMAMFYDVFPAEDEMLFYNVGALLQLENDLFDVYKDHRDGISTLVTKPDSIADLRKLYCSMWQQVKTDINKTVFSEKGKRRFRCIIGALVSRGYVCLDMLAKREQQNKGRFNPAAFSRKELICDMEKPLNMLMSMHYYARLV